MGEDTECVHIVIETEHVIEAVRSHRLLWDPSNDLYTAKEARRRAWNDICRTLMTDWDNFDEHDQNDVERKVQQRWRTARDCFVKARAARLSPRATRRDKALRSYSHYDRLGFLEETLRTPGTVSLSRPLASEASAAGGGVARRPRRRRHRRAPGAGTPPPAPIDAGAADDDDDDATLSVFERRLLATLALRADGGRQRSPLEEDDEHFFRSLAPMLAVLDHRQKLQFRSNVLEEVQRRYREHIEAYSYVDVGEQPPLEGEEEGEDEPPDSKYRPPPTLASPLDDTTATGGDR